MAAPEFDQVMIKDATDIKIVARCAETTVKVIKDLNPACLRWATPPKTEIMIKVPHGSGELCQENLTEIPAAERVTCSASFDPSSASASTAARP